MRHTKDLGTAFWTATAYGRTELKDRIWKMRRGKLMKDKIKIVVLYLPAVITLIKTICGVIWAKINLPGSISAFIFEIYSCFTEGKLWFLYPIASVVVVAVVVFLPKSKKGIIFGGIILNVISIICWTMLSVASQ